MGVSPARIAKSLAAGNADISPLKKAELREKVAMQEVKEIELTAISLQKNVRTVYDEQSIKDLAQSIEVHGVMVPICVYEDPQERCRYIVKWGHLRVKASLLTTRTTIPAFVSTKPYINEDNRIEEQLIENIDREDPVDSDIEAAIGALIGYDAKHGIFTSLARRIGKDRMYVARYHEAWKLRQDVDEQTRARIADRSARNIVDLLHSIPGQGDYAQAVKAFEGLVARQSGPVVQDPDSEVVPEVVPSKGAVAAIEDATEENATEENAAKTQSGEESSQDLEHKGQRSLAQAIAPDHAPVVMPFAHVRTQAAAATDGEGRATPEPAAAPAAKAATPPQGDATSITEWQVTVTFAQGKKPKISVKSMNPGWDIPERVKVLISDIQSHIEKDYLNI